MRPSLRARGTLKDIASAVGVSHTTVSNAFSRHDQLSFELRERILAVARSMSYPGPNPAARMLRTGLAQTIAVVLMDPMSQALEDQATTFFLAGAAEACVERGLGLLLVEGGPSSSRCLQTAAIDGVILYSMPSDEETLRMVSDRALPTVVVDQPTIANVPVVGVDDRAAAGECARHLRSLGHKQFSIVSLRLDIDGYRGLVQGDRIAKARFEVSRRRIEGYCDVLGRAEADCPVRIWECPSSTEADGRTAAEGLLALHPQPTAILAASDRLAIGVMEALGRNGLRVPEDLSIVGFDDVPIAEVIMPQLTTTNQPLREKGRLAVSALLDGKKALRRDLPTHLIIRASTSAARARISHPSGLLERDSQLA